jgi:hypothetical protein
MFCAFPLGFPTRPTQLLGCLGAQRSTARMPTLWQCRTATQCAHTYSECRCALALRACGTRARHTATSRTRPRAGGCASIWASTLRRTLRVNRAWRRRGVTSCASSMRTVDCRPRRRRPSSSGTSSAWSRGRRLSRAPSTSSARCRPSSSVCGTIFRRWTSLWRQQNKPRLPRQVLLVAGCCCSRPLVGFLVLVVGFLVLVVPSCCWCVSAGWVCCALGYLPNNLDPSVVPSASSSFLATATAMT